MNGFVTSSEEMKEMIDAGRLRAWAEIDLCALRRNYLSIREALPEATKLVAVVKADAYGHGALPVAKTLEEDCGCDYFAVATIEEALELRTGGIKSPVLVLGYTPVGRYAELAENDIMPTVDKYDEALELGFVFGSLHKKARIHLALDTGMSRIGFSVNESSLEIIKRISELENVEIEGIYSHFSTADEINKDYSMLQLKRFSNTSEALGRMGVKIPFWHIHNSAGILDIPPCCDMARAGIILYGMYPSRDVSRRIPLRPVMSFRTRVIFVKTIPAGTPVGYGRSYVAEHDTLIATMSAGYADGMMRSLSNKGSVLVRGMRAPICGRICMDQFMADVTGIPGVTVGDTVTVIGSDGSLTIDADEVADAAGTISYELFCGISKRVPRIYMNK